MFINYLLHSLLPSALHCNLLLLLLLLLLLCSTLATTWSRALGKLTIHQLVKIHPTSDESRRFPHKTPSSVGWIQLTSLKIRFHFTLINKLDKHNFRPICFLPLFNETNVFCFSFLEKFQKPSRRRNLRKFGTLWIKMWLEYWTKFFVALQSNAGLGHFIFEICRSHTIENTYAHTQ